MMMQPPCRATQCKLLYLGNNGRGVSSRSKTKEASSFRYFNFTLLVHVSITMHISITINQFKYTVSGTPMGPQARSTHRWLSTFRQSLANSAISNLKQRHLGQNTQVLCNRLRHFAQVTDSHYRCLL
jgi:hypothetical protein